MSARAETVEIAAWPALMTDMSAALYLGRSAKTIQRLRADGALPPRRRVGGTLMYRRADLDAWMASLPTEEEQAEIDEKCKADEAFE